MLNTSDIVVPIVASCCGYGRSRRRPAMRRQFSVSIKSGFKSRDTYKVLLKS
jgi:hypothetical protein